MARRSKKARITLAGPSRVYDRRSQDLTINAVVAPVEITDPFGDKVIAMQSLRDDPLFRMFSRDQIDQAQYEAGRIWQRHMEATEVGNIRAIDPTKEAVDGGRAPEPLSDSAARAFKELARAHRELGMIGENIIKDILGSRLSIIEMAARRGYTSKAEVEFMGRRFREALDTLAVVFGCATGRK